MACQVGKGTEGLEDVTFLYRLTPGACPKSYGVNVARIAGKLICVSCLCQRTVCWVVGGRGLVSQKLGIKILCG